MAAEQMKHVVGYDVYGTNGERIGRVGQLFLDDQTGLPEFITVRTGLVGTHESFVPTAQLDVSEGHVTVPFSKDRVKDAPHIGPDRDTMSQDDEKALYEYYGIPYSESASDTGLPGGEPGGRPEGPRLRRDDNPA